MLLLPPLPEFGYRKKMVSIHMYRLWVKKYPYQISGGEQQRVNIIRALSMRPKLLLCDEPTGNLDSENSEIVTDLLKTLSAEFGSTLVVVTHDDHIASCFPNRIYISDGTLSKNETVH